MNRIKELREEQGMKQLALAKLLDVEPQTVSRYERSERQITPREIRRFCEIFGCTADYLLGLSSVRSSRISEEDAALVAAYHAAPESVRQGIDALLAPYMGEAGSNTAVS